MSQQRKRKHTTLTLVQKFEILNKIEKGDKLVNLANEFGIGHATIHDIRYPCISKIKYLCILNHKLYYLYFTAYCRK